jgi:hypothetical protein
VLSIKEAPKPSNAGYIAKATVNPDGGMLVAPAEVPADHQFRDVEVVWYGADRVKITLKKGVRPRSGKPICLESTRT